MLWPHHKIKASQHWNFFGGIYKNLHYAEKTWDNIIWVNEQKCSSRHSELLHRTWQGIECCLDVIADEYCARWDCLMCVWHLWVEHITANSHLYISAAHKSYYVLVHSPWPCINPSAQIHTYDAEGVLASYWITMIRMLRLTLFFKFWSDTCFEKLRNLNLSQRRGP